MWRSLTKLVLLVTAVEDSLSGCNPNVTVKSNYDPVPCMRFRVREGGPYGGCYPEVERGYALRGTLERCTKSDEFWHCSCQQGYQKCIDEAENLLVNSLEGGWCIGQLVQVLRQSKILWTTTTTTNTTPTAIRARRSEESTASTSERIWPIATYTPEAVVVENAIETDVNSAILHKLITYRVARLETRRKAALHLLILSTCMVILLLCQLLFIRMLRDAHRRQYEYYVHNLLRESRRSGRTEMGVHGKSAGSGSGQKSASRSLQQAPKKKHSAEKGHSSSAEGIPTKKPHLKSTSGSKEDLEGPLATFRWNTIQRSLSDDETTVDFYSAEKKRDKKLGDHKKFKK